MSKIPHWTDLSDQQRRSMESIASTFGTNISGERVDDMVLPNEGEAHCIALEMFMMSRRVIEEYLEAGTHG